MSSPYSIIIPIHNEINVIEELLDSLKKYSKSGHEIIIIDDGSHDGSESVILKSNYNFVKKIILKTNQGKGVAIKKGVLEASHNKIIIFDGDMELDPKDINKLMILDKKNNINCVFGSRYKSISPFKSHWNFGNYFFTIIFNFVHNSNLIDSLCCAKSFYKEYINPLELNSSKFDIDVELASKLIKKIKNVSSVKLDYERRTTKQGKKLRVSDSLSIFFRIIRSI